MKKLGVKQFGGNSNSCKIYNKNGLVIFDEDWSLIGPNDVLYFAP